MDSQNPTQTHNKQQTMNNKQLLSFSCAMLLLLVACDRTPDNNGNGQFGGGDNLRAEPTAGEMPNQSPNWAQNFLQVVPLYSVTNHPVVVTFNLYGPDGCYRQSNAKTSLDGNRIMHRYRTWSEGDFCTEALVPGGFTATVTPEQPGIYRGETIKDDEVVASYTLFVFPNRQTAALELRQALTRLSPWELTQVVTQVSQMPDGNLELALVKVVTPYIVDTDPQELWLAIATWLQTTPDLDIVRAAKPALLKPANTNNTSNSTALKRKILERLAP